MKPVDALKWSLGVDLLQTEFKREEEIFPDRFETPRVGHIGEYVKKELQIQWSRTQTLGKVTLRALVLCPAIAAAVEAGEYIAHHV